MTERATWRQRFADWITPGKWVVIATTANVLSTGIFIFASVQVNTDARQHNCALLEQALDRYTAGLIAASDEDRTPAEEAEVARRVVILKDTYAPVLADCK